jgi:YesN/AraC family two-component response regulator
MFLKLIYDSHHQEVRCMFSLLIVEDEPWILQGLCRAIDWEAEGFQLIGGAADGEEALALIDQHRPDLIITDVRMPRMDGIALLEEIRRRRLESRVIVISGYSEFEYAQKALKAGAVDYLLKPVQKTELVQLVRKIGQAIMEERENREQVHRMTGTLRESLPLARAHFLQTLLTRGAAGVSAERIERQWHSIGLDIDPSRLYVITAVVHDWGPKGGSASDLPLLMYALTNMAEETAARFGPSVAFSLDLARDAMIEADLVMLHTDHRETAAKEIPKLYESLPGLIQEARRLLGVTISLGCSRLTQVHSLPQAFEEAMQLAAQYFYKGFGNVFLPTDPPGPAPNQACSYAGPAGWDNRFAGALKLGNLRLAKELVDELAAHVSQHKDRLRPLELVRGLRKLMRTVHDKVMINYQGSYSTVPEEAAPELTLPPCTLDTLPSALIETIGHYQQSVRTTGNRRRFVELAIQYIQRHQDKGITLNEVADALNINPSYFSKMFHEETGETFSKFLLRLRMDKAKQLLRETTLRIYEIAVLVGYNDVKYFTKLFKESEGMSPVRYRELGH